MMNHETTFDSILKAEAYVSASDLISEIKPLIEDYFVCNAEIENSEIKVQFYNGQKFRICVKED